MSSADEASSTNPRVRLLATWLLSWLASTASSASRVSRTSDRNVWRACKVGLVLTVTRVADGSGWTATVESANVTEQSPAPLPSEAYTAADIDNHSPGDVEGFLAGLELVPPGLVAARNWRGGWHDVPATPPGPAYALGAAARKPLPGTAG